MMHIINTHVHSVGVTSLIHYLQMSSMTYVIITGRAETNPPHSGPTGHNIIDSIMIQIWSTFTIGYSHGGSPLAGHNMTLTSGGQCLEGFRMVLYVLPADSEATFTNPPQTTTTFTEAPIKTDSELETNESAANETTTSEMSYITRVTDDGSGTATIRDKNETLLIIVMLCSITIIYSFHIS